MKEKKPLPPCIQEAIYYGRKHAFKPSRDYIPYTEKKEANEQFSTYAELHNLEYSYYHLTTA